MTVEQHDSIDAIGIDKLTGEVILTISDHLHWENKDHLLILQDKINSYITFIESGELLKAYPAAQQRKIAISVCCKYPPQPQDLQFLQEVATVLEGISVRFIHQHSRLES